MPGTISIIFCMQLLSMMRKDYINFWLGTKSIKGFFRGVRGASISKIPLSLFIVQFFWNFEHFFLLLSQGDSIRLKLKYPKGAPFFILRGRGQYQNYHYFYLQYDFYKIWNIFCWCHYKVIQLGWKRNFREGSFFCKWTREISNCTLFLIAVGFI